MANFDVQKLVGVIVLIVVALAAISHSSNHHNSNHHQQQQHPCCRDSQCIRIRYDSHSGDYDWFGGCCIAIDHRNSHCRTHSDGYMTVQAFCDYRHECYKRSNVSREVQDEDDNNKPIASMVKANLTSVPSS